MGGRQAPLRVSAAQERAFRLARHGLIPDRAPAGDVRSLAETLFGLHAARQITPWVALRGRLPAFQSSDLRELLLAERTLIKVRCMRQTLHILPLTLAATAHHATLRQRLGPCRTRLRALGRSERSLRLIAARIRERMGDEAVPYLQLQAIAARGHRPEDVALARLAIKWLWETGELAHVDLSPSLHHEHRAFARTAVHYPGLELRPNDVRLDEHCERLVHHHIRAFGPVSLTDTAWWSGLGLATVRRAVERLAGHVVPVRVRGIQAELLLDRRDADALAGAAPLEPNHVALLAHEDPALKGYFETRARYVRAVDYPQLFNQIGEARASIMLGGMTVGIWGFDRRQRRITHRLLRPVPAPATRKIEDRLADMESFLRMEPLHSGSTDLASRL